MYGCSRINTTYFYLAQFTPAYYFYSMKHLKHILIILFLASCTAQHDDITSANKRYRCWANIPTTGQMIYVDTTVAPEYLYDKDGNKGLCNCEGY